MKFDRLLEIVEREPVFETGLLLAGDVDLQDIRRQLTRWVQTGRLFQLRRGLYTLAPPFCKVKPHPFVVANSLVRGSYVSLQSALGYHGLIPEIVQVTTSVGTSRSHRRETPLGSFLFRHIQGDLLRGFAPVHLGGGQSALLASPEKALLDLIYLEPEADSPAYLAELRLQNLERLNPARLTSLARDFAKPKLRRAADHVIDFIRTEGADFEVL